MPQIWQNLNGIVVPVSVPDQIGLGCPKCDDHELASLKADKTPSEVMAGFVAKHRNCGKLDTLEMRDGKLVCTGFLAPPPS